MASIKTISKILIIIPAYNEAGCIEKVVDNLERNYPQYDYVVINDGSTDDTRKICARRGYNFMDLPVNTGLSGAIKSGMRYANYYGYDYVLQLDGVGILHRHPGLVEGEHVDLVPALLRVPELLGGLFVIHGLKSFLSRQVSISIFIR